MLDLIVIGIIVLFMYLGYRHGLIRTVFSLVSFVLAISLAIYLFPIVADWLTEISVYDALKDYIMRTMNLSDAAQYQSEEVIANLPLPDLIRGFLYEHNTPNVFELLNVSTIEEYIAAYFARLAINIISKVAVFIIVKFTLSLLAGVLDLVARLPVIKQFNKGGGMLLGFTLGLIIVWIGLAVMILFFLDPTGPELMTMLDNSLVVGWIYENNPIMRVLGNIQ